jgi:hypothetical protein
MTDPYAQHPNPYGQQPGGHTPHPPGVRQNPPGQGQPNAYGAQPNPHGQQPDPHGGQAPYAKRPDRYRHQDPEATQVLPYGGQHGPGQPHQYGQRHDQYPTRQYEPSQLAPGGQAGRVDPYGPYQGSYGQPPGWGQDGGLPPGPPRKRPPIVLFTVLAVLVIVAGMITAVILARSDGSTPVAQTTAIPSASSTRPETTSRKAPASTTTQPPATVSSTSNPSSPSSKKFEAGQCATLTPQPGNRATLNEALCGGGNSDVIVALVQDGDCAKDYITFNADVGKVYCLALDAEEGACFRFDQLVKRAPKCAAGTHKVAKIFEKVTDSTRCDQVQGVDRRYAYPQPVRTVCLVPAA